MSYCDIYGIEKQIESLGQTAKWNRRKIRWTLMVCKQKEAKKYLVELQLVVLSAQRIVRVNNEVKHRIFQNLTYHVDFIIVEGVMGTIKQSGIALNFDFLANGVCFESLAKKKYTYQPPKLQLEEPTLDLFVGKQTMVIQNIIKEKNNFRKANDSKLDNQHITGKIQTLAGLSIVPKTTQVKGETNLGSVLDNGKTRDNELKPKQGSTFDAIKQAQQEMLKVMLQEKRKAKQAQKEQQAHKEFVTRG